jgi:hypothetical protein
MSDASAHEFDHWYTLDEYLDYGGEEVFSGGYLSTPNYIRKLSTDTQNQWYYHGWYDLVVFHKDFEKAILITLRTYDDVVTYLVPKSIIGKLVTTVDFKANTSISKYLIHNATLRKISEVEVTYTYIYDDYKFVEMIDNDRCIIERDNRSVVVSFSDLTYVRWTKIEEE